MASILIYSTNQPPLSCLAALEWTKVQVKIVAKSSLASPPTICLPNGIQLEGEAAGLRYLCRLADSKSPSDLLYCRDPVSAATIDFFIDLAFITSENDLPKTLSFLDNYLKLRTFLLGHTITAADLAVWGAITALGHKKALPLSQHPHLNRYLSHCSSLPEFSAAFATAFPAKKAPVDNAYNGAQAITLDEKWMGKVVTRFPPEPSGYLHIGHAKAAILNYDVMKRYKGRLILRFDDTNPAKEKQEFVDSIIHDLETLGVIHTPPITYSSDHFDYLAQKCTEMIKAGRAYVDFTEKMKAREEREKMIDGQCRGHSIEENLRLWDEMQKGTPLGLTCVVRAKISMQHRNAAMRDPAMVRCNTTPHHRTGDKYKVYPTYDFTCPLIDSLEGVTHALRTIEYRDRNEQYSWFCQAAGVREPEIIDFARMNLVNTVLSKRKLTRLVESHVVTGWDDPRFPTVQGMVRRGLQVAALREFVLDQGASKSVALMEWDKIWNMNKRVIDPVAHRYTIVGAPHPVRFHLIDNNNEAVGSLSIRLVPKDESRGNKTVPLNQVLLLEQQDINECSLGEEVTLMGWGNAIIESIERDQNGIAINATGRLNLSGDFKKTKKKLTWIAADHPDTTPVTLVDLDYLIKTPKLDASLTDEEFERILNRDSWKESAGLGEVAMRSISKGQVIQLNRRGFYICDRSVTCPGAADDGRGLVLIYIPDGRMTTPTSSRSRS